MLSFARSSFKTALWRVYSTEQPKSAIQLVSELRKLTDAPVLKARQALKETNNDFQAALKWLEEDLLTSGSEKAEKVKGRDAKEGLIGVYASNTPTSGIQAAIIELSCETDFVSRNDAFGQLARDIAQAVATDSKATENPQFQQRPVEEVLEVKLGSGTVNSGITEVISRTRENILLRRAAFCRYEGGNAAYRIGTYIHNSLPAFPSQGRIGGLAIFRMRPRQYTQSQIGILEGLENAIARQVVGFNPTAIDSPDPAEDVLYHQTLLMGGQQKPPTVREYLQQIREKLGMEELLVQDIIRWQVGEFLRQK
jgi:elongation factor Ts